MGSRRRGLCCLVYARGEAAPGYGEPADETTVEYDEGTRLSNSTGTTTLLETNVHMPLEKPAKKSRNTASTIQQSPAGCHDRGGYGRRIR